MFLSTVKNTKIFINNFNYTNYETFIITKDMEKKAGWMYMIRINIILSMK